MTLTSHICFAEAFADLERRQDNVPAWTRDLRRRSFDEFVRVGLPSRKDEDWKYTSLRLIEGRTFKLPQEIGAIDEAILDRLVVANEITFVVVDGILSKAHSRIHGIPPGLTLLPVDEAMASQTDWRSCLTAADMGSIRAPFEYLSRAFLGVSGIILSVDTGVTVDRPIHIVHVATSAAKDRVVLPRHRLILAEAAEAHFIESFVGPDAVPYLTVPVTDITMQPNSKLSYCRIQTDGNAAVNIGSTTARLAADAKLTTFAYGGGARLSRLGLDVVLDGRGASTTLDGLYLTRGDQHLDNHTTVDHAAPATKSQQVYKGILNGASRAVFNGKIIVRNSAPQTEASQLNKNLLLSSAAEIDTKPELAIDVDDVKCSHGAAVGGLDAKERFYLQSRGLDSGRAERLLMRAFSADVIHRFGQASVESRLFTLAEMALI